MKLIMVDVETDGPVPYIYSMLSLGAVVVEEGLKKRFYCEMYPISQRFDPNTYKITGFTRKQTLEFPPAYIGMRDFNAWLHTLKGNYRFISDNNGFDWMFVCWYFYYTLGHCPFGWSSSNMRDLYTGITHNAYARSKKYKKSPHTHNALDDAISNAEIMLGFLKDFPIKGINIGIE